MRHFEDCLLEAGSWKIKALIALVGGLSLSVGWENGPEGNLRQFLLTLNHVIKANSTDPDQTPQNAASDLGLHCLPGFYR